MSDTPKRVRKIRLHKGKDGDWYLTQLGGNGEPLFTSEGFASKSYARSVAEADYPDIEVVEE